MTFTETDLLGVYTATPVVPGRRPAPSGGASPSAHAATDRPAAPAARAAAVAAPSRAGDDPTAPVRFAVDLFDVDESTIAPGSAAALEELGRAASPRPPPRRPGASSVPSPAAADRPTARDELWVPIVLLVLVAAVRRVGASTTVTP